MHPRFGLAVCALAAASVSLVIPQFTIACPGEIHAGVPKGGQEQRPTSPMTRGEAMSAGFNIQFMSQVPLSAQGGGAGSSLWGWTDPVTRREYAIMGRSNGTSFIDITNPTQPIVVADLPKIAGSANTSWREPKVFKNVAYIGVDGTSHGIQVFDLTRLRQYNGTTMTMTANSVYTGVTKVHTLAMNPQSGYLYACGTNTYSGGLHMINVNNPLSPVAAGGFSADGYTHEAQVVTYRGPHTQYQGREIAFASNTDTLTIVDVTNKAAPVQVGRKGYSNYGYVHQGWLTPDQKYFVQNDELDEQRGNTNGFTRTHLWDVSNLANPVYKGYWDNTTFAIDHNLYVVGDLVYQANYTTGLRILRIGDLSSTDPSKWFKEVAFFDTYAPNDGATFNGAWNVYPYFDSGNVVVSDINGGLFVLRPDMKGIYSDMPKSAWLPAGPILNAVPEPSSALVPLGAGLLSLSRRRR